MIGAVNDTLHRYRVIGLQRAEAMIGLVGVAELISGLGEMLAYRVIFNIMREKHRGK